MKVLSSTQAPSSVQSSVAHSLGLPLNKVIVSVKRAGGGYGGKISNATVFAGDTLLLHRALIHMSSCLLSFFIPS